MKTKVCHILSDVNQSHLIETFGEVMDKNRYEISYVFMNKQKPPIFDSLTEKNYAVEFIEFNGRKELPSAVLKLRKILKRIQPEIVHTHLVEGSLAGLLAAKTLGIKKRVHTRHHSNECHIYYPHGVYYDKTVNALSKRIIAISNVVADVLIKNENVKPEKVAVIPHGFELENFIADAETVEDLKKKYNLGNHYPVIGSISRFIHWKGVQNTVTAFKELLADYPRAKLVLAYAGGPYSAEIYALLEEILPAESYVTIPFEKEIFALYKNFDVFVHVPVGREPEAFGQVYVESLTVGVPSVFTLSGIANDFIENEVNAVVVPYNDARAIGEAIKLILSQPELRDKIVERGREDVWKLFHADRLGVELDALYTKL